MSLIIEALKRARDDTVRRQAASRGLPMAPVPRIQGRSRWLTVALIPLAGALAICILLLIDLYTTTPQVPAGSPTISTESSQTGPTVEGSSPQTAVASSIDSKQGLEQGSPEDAGVLSEQTPAPADPQSSIPEETPLVQDVTSSDSRVASVAPAPNEPRRTESSPTGDTTGREFVGQAQLKDGQLLDLEGIAWSESDPFALLNGQVIGEGELVRAYRVVEIRQDLVVLEKHDDRIVLRLK